MRSCLSLVFLLALVAGCSKLTVENYDKLKVGMKYAEVKALLGEPADCGDVLTVKACTWGDEKRSIKVSFVADQVVVYSSTNLR